jgi:hypothetical protein
LTRSEEARWFYSLLASVAAGASIPRAFLQSAGIECVEAVKGKMHIIRGLSPDRFTLPSRGWNTLLSFLVRSHRKMPSLAGPTAAKLMLLLYENRRLIEEWEARRRAYALKGAVMVAVLSLALPFIIHISPFIAFAWGGGPMTPASTPLIIWGLSVLMVSSYLFATVLGYGRNPVFIVLPPLLYSLSHVYAARMVAGVGA